MMFWWHTGLGEKKEPQIFISIEFHIFPENPQKHLAWIFKLVVDIWKGMTDIYARLLYFILLFLAIAHHAPKKTACPSKKTNCSIWLKSFFLSLHSDAAAQLKSDVYVWERVQGLDIVYRFE